MTPMEAWHIISKRLAELHHMTGYNSADLEAEVICFQALKEMEEKQNAKNDK